MKVKVCGITTVQQMKQLQRIGAEYAGIILYKGSKRFGGDKLKKDLDVLKEIAIKKVGVFVNEDLEAVKQAVQTFGLYAVQLHGDETLEYCSQLMKEVMVIKAFRISVDTQLDELVKPYENACHYYLFDTWTEGYGGSGRQFDWNVLHSLDIKKPFFLSGGISPEDVNKVQAFSHTSLHAIDINSRFEVEPGVKNMVSVESFVNKLRIKVNEA